MPPPRPARPRSCGSLHTMSFQIKQQHCQIGRGDATHPTRLPKANRPDLSQLIPCLAAELWNGGVIERRRDALTLQLAEPLHLARLSLDVPAVLRLQDDLLHYVGPRVPLVQRGVPVAQVLP